MSPSVLRPRLQVRDAAVSSHVLVEKQAIFFPAKSSTILVHWMWEHPRCACSTMAFKLVVSLLILSNMPTLSLSTRSGRKSASFAREWAGLEGSLSNFVDAGIRQCAEKKPTHGGFVRCTVKFCVENTGGLGIAKDLTRNDCLKIEAGAEGSDIRKRPATVLMDDTGLDIPLRLRDRINVCGKLGEKRASHQRFMTCLERATLVSVRKGEITASEAKKLLLSGLQSSVGEFGEPGEGGGGSDENGKCTACYC